MNGCKFPTQVALRGGVWDMRHRSAHELAADQLHALFRRQQQIGDGIEFQIPSITSSRSRPNPSWVGSRDW
jgi:hypothetical protein